MTRPEQDGVTQCPWRFCLAPMMQRTDRHFRQLLRLISPNMRLYTEMIHTGAILRGDRRRFLAHAEIEHPVALQLGGSDPKELSAAASLAVAEGYDEVNLNCGCPSDRVQSGQFGACLMRSPDVVVECVAAMLDSCGDSSKVSVKTRLGVDHLYSYQYFRDFIGQIAVTGCRVFHIHARKAWLDGLSPRENREIPPLEYEWVYRLKREFPELVIVLNGGIRDLTGCEYHLDQVDGVMLGRYAYDNPFAMQHWDRALFGSSGNLSREAVIESYLDYVEAQCRAGVYLKHMSRHLLNLYRGQPGAKSWRRTLTIGAADPRATGKVLCEALAATQAVSAATTASQS